MNKKIVVVLVLLLVGCTFCFANGTSENGAQKTKTYKVGVINTSDADENCYLAFKTFKNVVESPDFEAKIGHKVTVEWTSSDLDVAKQMNNCETLLSKGVDAILMIGLDNDSSSSVVKACNDAGVDIFMVASE
ncbi:MAG: substrate-binding domain-containing protein, partial [Bacteroidales bacterium]|nr:substrate-binding domain-containing protein [Bacteroidales bacterium]